MDLFCGSAKVMINPPLSTYMAGYMAERPVKAIHDSLYSKVLYLKKEAKEVVIISLDLVAVDIHYVHQLREKINLRFGISENDILVHATHTHSGPGGTINQASPVWKAFSQIWRPFDLSLVEQQHAQIIQAVETARLNSELCTVRVGQGKVFGIGANRISKEKEYDPNLFVLEFVKSNGKKIILYNFACHPTILHQENMLVSADFPGAASRNLEELDEIETAIFVDGPSGDISTRFTRRESTFDEVERIGLLLSNGVIEALSKAIPVEVNQLAAEVVPFEFSIRKMADESELNSKLLDLRHRFNIAKEAGIPTSDIRKLESEIEGVVASMHLAKNIGTISEIKTEIQLLAIGHIYIVALPGEVFHETGKKISDRFNGMNLLLLGNTNDYIGYIVPAEYYDKGNYEASMTLLEKDSEEKLRDLTINTIGG